MTFSLLQGNFMRPVLLVRPDRSRFVVRIHVGLPDSVFKASWFHWMLSCLLISLNLVSFVRRAYSIWSAWLIFDVQPLFSLCKTLFIRECKSLHRINMTLPKKKSLESWNKLISCRTQSWPFDAAVQLTRLGPEQNALRHGKNEEILSLCDIPPEGIIA